MKYYSHISIVTIISYKIYILYITNAFLVGKLRTACKYNIIYGIIGMKITVCVTLVLIKNELINFRLTELC